MTVAQLPPTLVFKAFDNTGLPLSGGLFYSYIAGTTTPQATYPSSSEVTPNTNPIVLNARGECALWIDPTLSYKFNLTDANGNQIPGWPVDNVQGFALTQALISSLLWPQTPAEITAGVIPANYAYPTLYGQRYGMLFNDVTDDTAALNNAILVGKQTVNGASGAAIQLPVTGTSLLSSEVVLPNRVRLLGYNKRGTYFQASAAWNSGTSPWMFHAVNGTSSMFDSTLENLTVDCNNTSGLGCILSDAWQDDCGLRGALLINFATSGIKFQNGYGGADNCKIVDTEIFGGTTASCIGIDLSTPIGSVGGFTLDVQDSVCAGGSAVLTAGISCKGNSLICRKVHFESCTSGILIDGTGFITLDDVDGTNTVTTLVTIASTFTGTLIMKNCRRNAATNFIVDNRSGGLGTITGYDPPLLITGTGLNPPVSPNLFVSNEAAPGILMNASGADYGYVANVTSTTWALGYGTSQTALGTSALTWNTSGAVTVAGALGVNGNSPPAQSTGWGTPTGAAVENNYAGASATLAVTSAAVAEIITVLKNVGILGT